jgi:uncharacterized protein (DUF1499 family)
MRRHGLIALMPVVALAAALAGCTTMAETTDQAPPPDSRLEPCPSSPNCVSSDGGDVPPFRLAAPPERAWTALREVLEARPRTEIVESADGYLRAEETSRLFRFVDDVEFELRPERGTIAVRSASRVGYWDLGVNGRRVAAIRSALAEKGVLE